MPAKGQFKKGKWNKCKFCNKLFWRCNSWIKKNEPKTCSWECRSLIQRKLLNREQEVIEKYKNGLGCTAISKEMNVTHQVICSILERHNIKRDNSYSLDKNPNWKGGSITPNGYRRIGRIMEHRLIVEKHIKRKLLSNEHVHHMNGNKLDNRIENLSILTPKPHGEFHAKQFNDWKKMYQSRIADLESIIRECICRKNNG